ncbi:MAG TPA: thiamine pyrophosphate-dependent enzyme, partial [Nocardioides sp.]|nr:thiamine pyrophosphate-dependent enzyme [Nocardioides sp.]
LLQRKTERKWQDTIIDGVEQWWRTMDAEAHVSADPVNPMRIFSEFSARAPRDSIVTADSGSAANWYARHIRMRGEMRGTLSGTLATMGPAVPYAIGAKFAHPDRPAIAFEGDGAMQMNGLAELITIARYWRRWSDPRLIVAVLHNNDLNQVTWELRAMGGTPEFVESQALPDVSYADFAAGLGLGATTVTDPDQLGGAWEAALAAQRPHLIDVRCDPDIPPIPPHATLEQMTDSAKALIKGDPSRWGVIKQGLKTKAQELLP